MAAVIDVARVSGLQPGSSCGARDNRAFVEIVRRQDGGLTVDCGWVVPEADEDDYGSSTHHPFKDGKARPWCGRRLQAADAAEAVRMFEARKAQVWGTGIPSDGERIGSVSR